jgi:ATP/maltotriose-dependent transcriptional regulator MalT
MPSEPKEPGRRPAPDNLVGRGTVVALLAWGVIVLAFSAGGLADVTSLWWLVLLFGLAAPVALLAVRGRALRNDAVGGARRAERELLAALGEHGELTPTAAAMLTSLTAAEAAKALEVLARGGHLEARAREGAISYTLREGDRRAVSTTPTAASAEPPGEASEEAAPPARPVEPLAKPLTDRELAILELVAAGRTNKEIAAELFVAEGTVKAHVASIHRKLGVHSRAEAVSRAADLNLI